MDDPCNGNIPIQVEPFKIGDPAGEQIATTDVNGKLKWVDPPYESDNIQSVLKQLDRIEKKIDRVAHRLGIEEA